MTSDPRAMITLLEQRQLPGLVVSKFPGLQLSGTALGFRLHLVPIRDFVFPLISCLSFQNNLCLKL